MKRFDIITESDARMLERGDEIVLVHGGIITPLAADTLRAKRVVVVCEGRLTLDELSLAPRADVRTMAVGSDHAGIALRRSLVPFLRGRGLLVHDLGTDGPDPVDYPDVAASVAREVARGDADAGLAIDGAGIGSAIAANKIPGVRAAMCASATIARYSREHNGANVLTLGSTLLSPEEAREIVDAWLSASMREPRYIRRLAKIRELEEQAREGRR